MQWKYLLIIYQVTEQIIKFKRYDNQMDNEKWFYIQIFLYKCRSMLL